MELIPARLLQPCAEAAIHAPRLTKRELELREHLIDAARRMFIQWGRMRVDVPFLAHSTRIAAITIRRHFGDMHHMFGLILHEYVVQLYKAVLTVKGDGEDLMRRRRAEYFRVTRSYCNVPSSLHFLLVKDRVTLPQDELEPIENFRDMIGALLGGEHGDHILMMLDHPTMDLAKAEALIATLYAVEAKRAEPEPPAPEPRSDPKPQAARPPLPEPKPAPAPPSWSPSKTPDTEDDLKIPTDPMAALSDEELRQMTAAGQAAAPIPKPPPQPPRWGLTAADLPPGILRRMLNSSATTPPSPLKPDLVSKTVSPEALSLDSRPPGRMSARLAGPAA
jgi:hypothetical protein